VRKFRLPKTIRLPGFKIRVVEGVLVDMNASWDYDITCGGVITLNKGLTVKQKQYYLAHELLHAVADYMLREVDNGAKP